MRSLLFTLLAGCISIAAHPGQADAIRSEPLPPPAPAGTPEAQEADAALAAGSNAALIRFLARHPLDPQAPRIRKELAKRRSPDNAAQVAASGPDAAAIAAFDAARLAGTAHAWETFRTRYASHPLVAEVENWR